MSNTNIGNIASQIRNETKKHGNTKKRVADVLDEINNFKADLIDGKVPLEQLPPISVDVPENLSEFNNDTNFITIEDVPTLPRLHQVATSGDYNDLENIPDIPVQVNTDWNSTSGLSQLLNKPLSFPPTAHKHSWDDIDNKPVIPAPVDITGKVDKTTTTISSPDATNKYVYLHSETNTTPKRMLAGDLGKNIANSKLTSVANAGLDLGAEWKLDTKGFPFKMTGLLNKSTDNTFNKLLIQDVNGDVANSDGKTLLKSIPSLLNEQEKTDWKTAMNGGWSTGTMSVGLISPPVIDGSRNNETWVVLKGANLNLNPANFKVELMSADGLTLIAEIPSSQVQLYTNGLDLIFYYNFSTLPSTQYKIRLWNGIATYTTPLTISVVPEVQNININAFTWNKIAYTPGQENNIFPSAVGGTLSYIGQVNNKALANEPSIIVGALKSNAIVGAFEDFYIEAQVSVVHNVGLWNGNINRYYTSFGLTDAASTLSLSNFLTAQVYRDNTGHATAYLAFGCADNGTNSIDLAGNNNNYNCVFIRKGGIITIMISFQNQSKIVNKSYSQNALSLGALFSNSTIENTTTSINIMQAYTF